MGQTIRAIYSKGVFKPLRAVDLPDSCEVEVEVRLIKKGRKKKPAGKVYEILSRRYVTGVKDLAARHNEHRP